MPGRFAARADQECKYVGMYLRRTQGLKNTGTREQREHLYQTTAVPICYPHYLLKNQSLCRLFCTVGINWTIARRLAFSRQISGFSNQRVADGENGPFMSSSELGAGRIIF